MIASSSSPFADPVLPLVEQIVLISHPCMAAVDVHIQLLNSEAGISVSSLYLSAWLPICSVYPWLAFQLLLNVCISLMHVGIWVASLRCFSGLVFWQNWTMTPRTFRVMGVIVPKSNISRLWSLSQYSVLRCVELQSSIYLHSHLRMLENLLQELWCNILEEPQVREGTSIWYWV